eukprot:TRINITY_DN1051_c0_g3_i1.p1 TRINITY_DN1051_c0_g3~~TRINITY_DN1051_c0_g3_i1.p1  ORF type:complete len:1236 (-),score=183.19 TRINITY_DN1051_c0_g3_i1:82-3789(-)
MQDPLYLLSMGFDPGMASFAGRKSSTSRRLERSGTGSLPVLLDAGPASEKRQGAGSLPGLRKLSNNSLTDALEKASPAFQEQKIGSHRDRVRHSASDSASRRETPQDFKKSLQPEAMQPGITDLPRTGVSPWTDVAVQIAESQFTFDDGQSACTAICCEVAVQLLQSVSGDSPAASDTFLEMMQNSMYLLISDGVALSRRMHEHSGAAGSAMHENAYDLLQAPPAQHLQRCLSVSNPQDLSIEHGPQSFLGMIAMAFGGELTAPRAVLLTKPPETVLVAWAPCLKRPFLLFDSHAWGGGGACLRWFAEERALAEALAERFPYMDMPDVEPFVCMMYNACEYTPICLREDAAFAEPFARRSVESNGQEACTVIGKSQHVAHDPGCEESSDTCRDSKPRPDARKSRDMPEKKPRKKHKQTTSIRRSSSIASNSTQISRNHSCTEDTARDTKPTNENEESFSERDPDLITSLLAPTQQLTDVERQAFYCPISMELMVDPVVASDGFTYEREMIENHWETQRQQAQQDEAGQQRPAADDCCGRRRARIQATSPLTNLPMANQNLAENRIVVTLIEKAVEEGRIPEGDGNTWRDRRRQALEQLRNRPAPQPEPPQVQPEVPLLTPEVFPRSADRVEILALPSSTKRGMFASKITSVGLAVDLCDASELMPLFLANGRCTIPACRASLKSTLLSYVGLVSGAVTCHRCGRVTCTNCATHKVKDFANRQSKTMCGECLEDLVDRLPATPEAQRSRHLIIQRLVAWAHQLEQQAAARERKHHSARLKTQVVSSLLPPATEPTGVMQVQASGIQIIGQTERPQPTDSMPSPTQSSRQGHDELAALQQQYHRLLAIDVSAMDADQHGIHFIQLSQVMDDLEIAQITALSQVSSEPAAGYGQSGLTREPTPAVGPADLVDVNRRATRVQELAAEYARLEAADISAMDAMDIEAHFMSISKVMADLEAAQLDAARISETTHARPQHAAQNSPQTVSDPPWPPGNPAAQETRGDSFAQPVDDSAQRPSTCTNNSRTSTRSQTFERDTSWPLPLDLQYPTPRMRRREMQIAAAIQRVRQEVELEHMQRVEEQRRKRQQKEERARQQRQRDADREIQRQRDAERRASQREQQEREQQRMANLMQAREREEQQRRAREEAERREQQEFQNLVNNRIQGIQMTGGESKMCGRCGAGPVLNEACNDMAAHNNDDGRIGQNHCPNCQWFEADWRKWPRWDGGALMSRWTGRNRR